MIFNKKIWGHFDAVEVSYDLFLEMLRDEGFKTRTLAALGCQGTEIIGADFGPDEGFCEVRQMPHHDTILVLLA